VVTLDHASGGRFELGIGWGSLPAELVAYGVTTNGPRLLAERMAESLQIMEALWTGATVNFQGQYFTLNDALQNPTPLGQIPIVIGGTGPLTMQMVARHATWWNVPVHQLKRLDTMRDRAGNAKVSVQRMVSFVGDGADRSAVEALARRRFGHMGGGLVVGDAAEMRNHFAEEAERGVERSYVWFADFADPGTLAEFGATVIAG
jgi:alkanesulfonate monooxygenase SsuD/methylene tetrahydromethanopterin reductase-like flavin-dependent oxidoreductase (luciferase family)